MIRPRIRNRGAIPSSEIEAAYRKVFNMSGGGLISRLIRLIAKVAVSSPFYFADAYYQEANEDLIKQVILENQADKAQYITEKKDCDNFAFALMGALRGVDDRTCAMPIFITWVLIPQGGHAVLSYYKSGAVKVIEPQSDAIFNVPQNWSLLLLVG